jgi:hypothetical protein
MRTTAKALAETIPHASYQELPGQRHDVDAKALANLPPGGAAGQGAYCLPDRAGVWSWRFG